MYERVYRFDGVRRISDGLIISQTVNSEFWPEAEEWLLENTPQMVQMPKEKSIDSLVSEKERQIKEQSDKVVAHLLSEFPEVERETFRRQEKQAEIYLNWYNSGQQGEPPQIPTIELFAQQRGLSLLEQALRVKGKADYFNLCADTVSAKRNQLHDELMAIKRNDSLTDGEKREAIASIDETTITCPQPPTP